MHFGGARGPPSLLTTTPLEPRLPAGGWQQQRRATSRSASRCSYDYGNDDGRLHQGKGSARQRCYMRSPRAAWLALRLLLCTLAPLVAARADASGAARGAN